MPEGTGFHRDEWCECWSEVDRQIVFDRVFTPTERFVTVSEGTELGPRWSHWPSSCNRAIPPLQIGEPCRTRFTAPATLTRLETRTLASRGNRSPVLSEGMGEVPRSRRTCPRTAIEAGRSGGCVRPDGLSIGPLIRRVRGRPLGLSHACKQLDDVQAQVQSIAEWLRIRRNGSRTWQGFSRTARPSSKA